MTNNKVFFIMSLLLCLSGCQGQADSDRDTPDNPDDAVAVTAPVNDLQQLENTLWLTTKRASNLSYVHYFYIQPDGRTWIVHRELDGTDSCYFYEEYQGQYLASGDNAYRQVNFDEEIAELTLNLVDGALVIEQMDVGDDVQFFPASESFNELPPLCDVEHGEVSDAEPITSLEQADGNWIVLSDTEYGVDRYEWVITGGQEYEYDYMGDSHTRADDCYDPYGTTGFYVYLEENRFLFVGSSGIVDDVRLYESEDQYFYANEGGSFVFAKGALNKDQLDSRVCANQFSPPPGSVELDSLADAQGLWDFSYRFNDGALDKVYLDISAGGAITLYDDQNDDVDQGEDCVLITEDLASLTPRDSGGFSWFLDQARAFFARALSNTVSLFLSDNNLVIADNFKTRTLRATERTLADLSPCGNGGNQVPPGAEPVRTVEELAGIYDLTQYDDDGAPVSVEYTVIDANGFVSNYLLDDSDTSNSCFVVDPDYQRFTATDDFIFSLVDFGEPSSPREIFVYQDSLIIKPVDANEISETLDISNLGQEELLPLCDVPEPPPPGFTEAQALSSIVGVWDVDADNFVLKISADGTLTYLALFDNVPQFEQQCFFEFTGEFFDVEEAGGTNGLIFNFADGFGVRRRAFIDGDTLILQDSAFTDVLTRSNLVDDEAQANCPTVDDIPPGSEEVVSIEQIAGLWDFSSEPLEGIVDEKYANFLSDGTEQFIDYLGDDYDDDIACYQSSSDRYIEFVNDGENTVRLYFSEDYFETLDAFIVDGNLLLADNDLTYTYTQTDVELESLVPDCANFDSIPAEGLGKSSSSLIDNRAKVPAGALGLLKQQANPRRRSSRYIDAEIVERSPTPMANK